MFSIADLFAVRYPWVVCKGRQMLCCDTPRGRHSRRLSCLRSHVWCAYCNFESKQANYYSIWATPKLNEPGRSRSQFSSDMVLISLHIKRRILEFFCEKSRGPPTSWKGLMHDPSEVPKQNHLTLPPTYPRQKQLEVKIITNWKCYSYNGIHLPTK